MNTKLILAGISVLVTTGCSTGTYTKDTQGNVNATGYAAVVAAGSNTSHKEECVGGCRNPGWGNGNNGSSHPNATSTQPDPSDFQAQMKYEAEQEAQRQMRWRIRREIQRAFGGW